MTGGALDRTRRAGRVGRIQALLWRRPWMRAALLLGPGLTWFVVIYLASLVLLLITAFWQINPFTTAIERVWNIDNFRTLVTDGTYRLIILRTIGLATAVTITDAVLAFPFAYYMARVASRRVQTALFAAVLLPLWASYLARVYAWILILNHDGVLNWSLLLVHLPPASLGYTNWAMWIVFSYIWLPFMIIPTYAALERIPPSYLEAAADLGARQGRTTWDIVLPLALRVWAVGILLFLFIPIALVIVYAFNVSTIQSWPIPGVTLKWFGQTWQDPEVRRALLLSVEAGLMATAVALVLGSMAAFAIHRFQFFGREIISFALVLPLALPGIITGMSLNSFFAFNQITFSLWTIVIGHATFCIVIVYNNVLARLRRTSSSLLEAAMDLGASGWRSFVDVTLPLISTALVAGALLAFALSFAEVIVTTFTAGGAETPRPLGVRRHRLRPRPPGGKV